MAARTFGNQWKRANIEPIHKKNDKEIVLNYGPVSLLPICNKVFEKLILNEPFKFFEDKICYLSINRVFARGIHVFVNYLQSRMTSFSSFDCNPTVESRGVFLDISTAFDRVWHDGLLFKLKQNGVSGNLFQLIKAF